MISAQLAFGCSVHFTSSLRHLMNSWAHCELTDKLLRWMLMNFATNSAQVKGENGDQIAINFPGIAASLS
jgi:hypothetical protein